MNIYNVKGNSDFHIEIDVEPLEVYCLPSTKQ